MNPARRAEEAQRLLDNQVLQDALDRLEKNALYSFKYSDPTESDYRERLYIRLEIIEEFRRHLRSAVQDGKIESVKRPSRVPTPLPK